MKFSLLVNAWISIIAMVMDMDALFYVADDVLSIKTLILEGLRDDLLYIIA
jgi:hypothetical protein